MRSHIKSAVVGGIAGGLVVALALLVLASGPSVRRTSADGAAQSGPVETCEEMHQMMEPMHDPGACQRMHGAMGPDAEKMMSQCTAMMAMMMEMQNMMPGSGTGMMGGQNGKSMQDMMRRMMAQYWL